MSIRDFAAHLGISDRMVSKWEAGGAQVRPRPVNQQALDTSLQQASPQAQARFADATGWPTPAAGDAPPEEQWVPQVPLPDPLLWQRPDIREVLARRDMARLFRMLDGCGLTVRHIAALVVLPVSEVMAILQGQRGLSYEQLLRIANGLGIPRGALGMAYCGCGHRAEVGAVR